LRTIVSCSQSDRPLEPDYPGQNPLLLSLGEVIGRVAGFKDRARAFYFEVVLSPYRCPECEGRLEMAGDCICSCPCGHSFDPTLIFQKSICCGSRLVKRTFHYACSRCNQVVQSRFLFDERVFDKDYFREMMQESRRRASERKEKLRLRLADSHSDGLALDLDPDLGAIPGLIDDLNQFIHSNVEGPAVADLLGAEFRMGQYRDHILSLLGWNKVPFSDIPPILSDQRKDKARRFVTLVFMQNDGEVDLIQDGWDIWVQKVYHEAYT
jgi:hypothetical protein